MTRRVILITGGSAGLGLATARKFSREGVDVAILARNPSRNAAARCQIEAEGSNCLTIEGDATDERTMREAVAAVITRFGRLDFGFNNAGAQQAQKPIPDVSLAEYQEQMDANVRSTFLGLKYMIPAIRASGGGAICNNASAAGITPSASQSIYAAAKFAVVGMTKGAALECAKDGIRVNVVCPGATEGGMFLEFQQRHPERAALALAKHPLGRIGKATEVAAAVLFLCRDATFTTGHALAVEGGRTIG